jgi:hypothetical protein
MMMMMMMMMMMVMMVMVSMFSGATVSLSSTPRSEETACKKLKRRIMGRKKEIRHFCPSTLIKREEGYNINFKTMVKLTTMAATITIQGN